MSEPIIAVRGLTVQRGGRTVLEIPELALQTGEVLAVTGPNGAGKSTLLQALALLIPARMEYRFAGRPADLPREALALRRRMAVVFQEPLLLEGTVQQNVALGLRLHGLPAPAAARRAAAWLERLGVAHLARRPAHALSGGEARRVSLARALALEPQVLFLDEPFASLDVLTRAALLQDLRPLLRAAGMTALLVTHDYAEVMALADRAVVLVEGRMVQAGTPREVWDHPAGPAVERLVCAAAALLQPFSGQDP